MNTADSAGPASGRVLIVDDDVRNRELLRELLAAQGHEVTEAENGEAALALVAPAAPHVILLDVMMPGMDGFEVCRRLKDDPATAAIPVLLVTALQERDDRLRGIEAGANDFLTKPIDTREVILRTRNAVHAKRLYDRVQEALERLQALERLRDNLIHMIVHDMRSPLMSVFGNLELLQMDLGDRLEEKEKQGLEDAMDAARKLTEMVTSLLDVNKLESGQMPLHRASCRLDRVAGDAVRLLGGILRRSPAVIEAPADGGAVSCDPALLQRVFSNLLGNAAKYSPEGRPIRVVITSAAGAVRVEVTDEGPGIPSAYHARIFEKFGQVEPGGARGQYSTGLGLTFCKLVVEAHGGQIGVDSEPGRGSTFWFVLPAPSA